MSAQGSNARCGAPGHGRVAGFTLVEILVALAVLAVVAVMAYGGLRQVLVARDHLAASDRRLAQVQKALLIMTSDFALAVPRGVRDETGTRWPALSGGADSDPDILLRFTRAGRPNPTGLRQSGLERIAYRFHDGRLERLLWPTLDRDSRTAPLSGVLLDHVRSAVVRFVGAGANAVSNTGLGWVAQWPPNGARVTPQAGVSLPAGIEISLKLKDFGTVRRVFVLPGQG